MNKIYRINLAFVAHNDGRGVAGSALVSTLLMIVVLTIIVTAFMQSMAVERRTANSYKNKLQAELAAEAGAEAAINLLKSKITSFPDSVTVWEPAVNSGGPPGTVLYYWRNPPPAAQTANDLMMVPLMSGGADVTQSDKANSLVVADGTVDINNNVNRRNHPAWIGLPPNVTSFPVKVPWVVLKDNDGKIVSRYSFFVEDESFKINTSVIGEDFSASNVFTSPSKLPLTGLFRQLGIASPETTASSLIDLRRSFDGDKLPSLATSNQITGGQSLLSKFDEYRFLATTHSSGLNLSRSGFKRVNLNRIVKSTPQDPTSIRQQLDKIIYPIERYSPKFGQRFYRTVASNLNADQVTASGMGIDNHAKVYLNKLAANIRDYISTDNQPTVVLNTPSYDVQAGIKPLLAFGTVGGGTSGAAEVIASGKKNVPYFWEYGLRARLTKFTPPGRPVGQPSPGPGADFEFFLDHYLEFWNPTGVDITLQDLGPNSFLKIYNQPELDTGAGTQLPKSIARDITIPLSEFVGAAGQPLVFKANSVTVLTTDEIPDVKFTPNLNLVFKPNAVQLEQIKAQRFFQGNTKLLRGTQDNVTPANGFSNAYGVRAPARTNSQSDYETEFLMGNDQGTIVSFVSLPLARTGGSEALAINNDTYLSNSRLNNINFFVRAGSLFYDNLGQSGDARSLQEQMRIELNPASDRTRFSNTADNLQVPGTSTLTGPNTNFVLSANWVDFSMINGSANNHPAVIARAPMTSIGELGHVYDPARKVGASGNILLSRGGGRTLKIGQPEFRSTTPTGLNGLWDGTQTSASRNWTSWRLTDLFSVHDQLQIEGLYNINGIRRDNGRSLRAFLKEIVWQPVPNNSSPVAGVALTDAVIEQLVSDLTNRLGTLAPYLAPPVGGRGGPFFERGEISELDTFNAGSTGAGTNFPVSGTNSGIVNDRTREELARRLIECITVRGNTFSIYVVAEAVRQLPPPNSGVLPIASAIKKVVVRLKPVFPSATDPTVGPSQTLFEDASGVPGSAQLDQRFEIPSRYELEIIE